MTDQLATPAERPANPGPARELSQAPGHAFAAFSINFARHATLPLRLRQALAWLTVGYLFAGAVCCCLLLGLTLWTHLDAGRLQQRLDSPVESVAAQASRQEMAELTAQTTLQITELQAMSAQLATRFPVGAKLAAVTTTLPARTWVTGLDATRDARTLTIKAAYLIDPEHPYELPTTRWIEALKADPAFGQGLKRLDLRDSSRETQGRAELFVFTLSAEWTPLP